MMFVALDEENRRVVLTSHEQAQQLRNRSFHCPICKQRLLIKNGVVMPAHFAHRQRSDNEGEPESVEHLTGKSWLVTWLRLHQQAATLEYYDANIRQRADILVHRTPPKVLEFQASPLSIPDLKKRTTMYHARGWEVTWILGRRYQHNRGKKQARKFLTLEDNLLTLWYLNSQAGKLTRVQLMPSGRLLTYYDQQRSPKQRWQPELVDGLRQARHIGLSLQKRVPSWLALQALAYQQHHNLHGVPWIVHHRSHPLRHFGIPELLLRVKWLLTFEGRTFTDRDNLNFWLAALPNVWTPLLPAGTLGTLIGKHWVELLQTAGFIRRDHLGYRWRQLPHWFTDIDHKLVARSCIAPSAKL